MKITEEQREIFMVQMGRDLGIPEQYLEDGRTRNPEWGLALFKCWNKFIEAEVAEILRDEMEKIHGEH